MKLYAELTVPHTEIIGDYDMNGNILILPIKGQGKANITLGKVHTLPPNNLKTKQILNFSYHKLSLHTTLRKSCEKRN